MSTSKRAKNDTATDSDWSVVETMTGDYTVVSVGGHQKDWIALRRAQLAHRVHLTRTRNQQPVQIKLTRLKKVPQVCSLKFPTRGRFLL